MHLWDFIYLQIKFFFEKENTSPQFQKTKKINKIIFLKTEYMKQCHTRPWISGNQGHWSLKDEP